MNAKEITSMLQEAFEFGIQVGRLDERITRLERNPITITKVTVEELPNDTLAGERPYHSSIDYATQGKRNWRRDE
jgi:hypothetical protein